MVPPPCEKFEASHVKKQFAHYLETIDREIFDLASY